MYRINESWPLDRVYVNWLGNTIVVRLASSLLLAWIFDGFNEERNLKNDTSIIIPYRNFN